MTFFGLKSGQDLKNWVAHPRQEFPGVPPRVANDVTASVDSLGRESWVMCLPFELNLRLTNSCKLKSLQISFHDVTYDRRVINQNHVM